MCFHQSVYFYGNSGWLLTPKLNCKGEDRLLKWHHVNTLCDLSICAVTQGFLIFHLVLIFFYFALETSTSLKTPFEVTCRQWQNTWHKWSVSTDVTETKTQLLILLAVECCSNCIVKKYIAVSWLFKFVIYEATVAVWQKC